MFVCFLLVGFLLLIFHPAPAALGKFVGASLLDDGLPLAVMGLLRGDVIDARMVMLGVIPGKVSFEPEFRNRKKGRFAERVMGIGIDA